MRLELPAPEAISRRAAWAAVIALGATVVVMRSIIVASVGMVPYKWIPDVRPLLAFGFTFVVAAAAAFGNGERRKPLLAFVALLVVGFTLEVSTVHWFTDLPGSITGQRIDPFAIGGALVAFAGVALLHAEVEVEALAADLRSRGAPETAAMVALLRRQSVERLAGPFGLAAGLAGLVAIVDLVVRDREIGPAPVALAVGAALVLGGTFFAWRAVKTAR